MNTKLVESRRNSLIISRDQSIDRFDLSFSLFFFVSFVCTSMGLASGGKVLDYRLIKQNEDQQG